MARPNKGLAHVDGQVGDPQSKQRLRAILSTIYGVQRVDEACEQLGLRRTQFQDQRARAIAGALAALAARPGGRPRRQQPLTLEDVGALQQRIAELEQENALLRAQVELAMTMPELIHDELPPPKSRGPSARGRSPTA
jgi:hypothetical protein